MTGWEQYADDLTAALRTVGDRVFLIASARERPLAYVQFAGGPDAVDAEASGAGAGPLAYLLEDQGWQPPHPLEVNWRSRLPRAASTAEHAELVARCVAALREAYGVRSPDDLAYRAWREREVAPSGVTWPRARFEALDPGEDPLVLPDLEPGRTPTPAPDPATVASWKAMDPAALCDALDVWARRSWPLAEEDAYAVATRDLGWEIEVEDGRRYVVHPSPGIDRRDVGVAFRRGQLSDVRLTATDATRDRSRAAAAFLGDAFAATVREASARWGTSAAGESQRDDPLAQVRRWTLPGGARVELALTVRAVRAVVTSPQGVAWAERDDEIYFDGL
ncbi:DUF6301 family protein [Nocardioides zeae]|uniref:DUF6301 family protein n=1 Tax=Nocardioides imazamoxiresistens TaxID=3231893 RepID=A0ABU3PUT6_9ACTN|nr:DUF6301 family protein [Nocardioides zeae]MDT9592987.1 DUF6301 family protein [Nocardioides zeae]